MAASNSDWENVTLSGKQDIDAILSPSKWSSTQLTFSFPDTVQEYNNFGYPDQTFSAFSNPAKIAARNALHIFENYTQLSFAEMDETNDAHANIRFANTNDASVPTANGLYPNWANGEGGDMHFNSTRNPGYANPVLGSYDFYTTMHEIGHALGLAHGHTPDSNNFNGQLPAGHNSIEYSIMTYRSYESAPQNNTIYARQGSFPQTLMQDDIAALQFLYGANYGYNSGDTVYTFDPRTGAALIDGVSQGTPGSNIIFRTIWDGGGKDTYDFSNYSTNLTINLNPGAGSVLDQVQLANLDVQSTSHYASANVYNALLVNDNDASLIENAFGGKGNDKITGNRVANLLDGGDGNDTIIGGDGNDRMFGGKGTNTIEGDGGEDYALFSNSRYSYTKAASGADQKFTGSGLSAGEITVVKADVEHTLFNVDHYGDNLVYHTTAGVTKAFVPLSGAAGVLQMNDDGYSNAIDISSVFNGGALNFFGSSYNHLYVNNNGNITFNNGLSQYTPGSIPATGFAIIAPFWGDVDTRVPSTKGAFANGKVSYDLDPVHGSFAVTWQSVDYYNSTVLSNTPRFNSFQLQLVDQGSGDFEIIFRYGAINWTTGTASGGNNLGLGGSVARAGFSSGDGTYGEYYELPQSGNQQQILDLDSAIGNTGIVGVWQWRVANGSIAGIGGDNDDTLNGDDGPNYIDGGKGNDKISGGKGNDILIGGAGNDEIAGGPGYDRLTGGSGDDTYIITDALDTIIEATGTVEGAKDTVQTAIDYTLAAYSKIGIEDLVLVGAALKGTGNEANNVITGNDKNNILDGGAGDDIIDGGAGDDKIFGGAGNDTLKGGAGKDAYDGGTGFDQVVYTSRVTVDLANPANNSGDAVGDTFINIELIVGSDFDDTLTGGRGNDGFYGGKGADIIKGGDGNDTIEGGEGADILDGGAGIDTLSYQHSLNGVVIAIDESGNGAPSGGDATGDVVTGFENITGSNAADIIAGNSKVNVIQGLGGDDILFGGGGADTLDGGTGSDTAIFTNETVGISIALSSSGSATVGKAPGAVGTVASLGTKLISIENVVTGDGSDVISGNAGANRISTGNGNDTISGGGGGDVIDGGDGVDTVSYAATILAPGALLFVTLGNNGALTTGNGYVGAGSVANDTLSNIENVVGTGGADVIRGNNLANTIDGGAGNDIISGGGGADKLIGGAGVDTVSYFDPMGTTGVHVNLKLAGGLQTVGTVAEDSFNDILLGFENIIGSAFADDLTGDDNNNTIQGGLGADTMSGGLGIDTLSYAGSANGVSVLLNGNLAAVVRNTGGDADGDQAFGFENITGSFANDTLGGDAKVNVIDGSNGYDTIDYELSTAGVRLNLQVVDSAGASVGSGGFAAGDRLISIENIIGSNFADDLTGRYINSNVAGIENRTTQFINGGAGSDTIHVGSSVGSLIAFDGGSDIDTAVFDLVTSGVTLALGFDGALAMGSGGVANESFANIENITGSKYADYLAGNNLTNVINAGAGNDFVLASAGGDKLDGGTGIDTLSFENLGGVVFNLDTSVAISNSGAATGLTTVGFENVIGSSSNDTIIGNSLDNVIKGGDGDDDIQGGAGTDTIEGGKGADHLSGGSGSDTLSYTSDTLGVTVTLNGSFGIIFDTAANAGSDAEGDDAAGFENLTGGSGADHLIGDNNANVINGGAGNDIIKGGGGADTIIGGAGADQMWGEGTASGVAAGDKFVLTSVSDSAAVAGQINSATSDIIFDFKSGSDKIDFSQIDANVNTTATNDAFHFVAGSSLATATAGSFIIQSMAEGSGALSGFENHVYADVNGDHVADIAMVVHTLGMALKSSDFVV